MRPAKDILFEAIESWKTMNNKYNYMSFRSATTVKEIEAGLDKDNNSTYAKLNLDKKIIHFGYPSMFNDKHEFEFKCLEIEW